MSNDRLDWDGWIEVEKDVKIADGGELVVYQDCASERRAHNLSHEGSLAQSGTSSIH